VVLTMCLLGPRRPRSACYKPLILLVTGDPQRRGVGVSSEYLGLRFTALSQGEPNVLGAADDVAIGQHKTVSADDDTGASSIG
jgi:hypothetical protein